MPYTVSAEARDGGFAFEKEDTAGLALAWVHEFRDRGAIRITIIDEAVHQYITDQELEERLNA